MFSSPRIRLGLIIGSGFLLSVLAGQATSYVVHRNQTSSVLKSVLSAVLFQENAPNFESDLRMLFSSLQANDEGSDHLAVVLCREGGIIASAPRWISSTSPFDCEVPLPGSLWKFEIRESIPFQDFPTLAIVHRELSPWNRYAVSTTLLIWLIGGALVLWTNRMTFERKRISSMLFRLEESLFSGGVSVNPPSSAKIPGWSADAGKILEKRVASIKAMIERAQKEYADSRSEAEVGKLAQHAAHDIRAPLAVIDFVSRNLSQFPESERILLRKAIGRFREIADDLLYLGKTSTQKVSASQASKNIPFDIYSLQSIVQEIVSEKAMQFKNAPELRILADTDPGQYSKFVHVQAGLLKRVLSNVVNNAADAMKLRGEVNVSIHESCSDSNRKLLVKVQDNGPGIPAELLSQLGNVKVSYGKTDGMGLGLFHAKETLLSWNGDLRIISHEGQGTCVEMEIPMVSPPAWFCPEINIPISRAVIILDDDPLIHAVWEQRFLEKSLADNQRFTPRHFFNGPDFSRWLELQPEEARNALFLIDLELAGEAETGMDLIERHGLGSSAIMVTSQYEDRTLIECCIRQGCQLLPKILATAVPIHFAVPAGLPGLVVNFEKTSSMACDAVLVDDDDAIREVWSIYADEAGKKLRAFASAEDFLQIADKFRRDIPIYLDANLKFGISGVEAAKELRSMKFTNIGLATGSPKEHFQSVPWIDFVGDKRPPWAQ
jgi:signal transduction histidine kinase/CheY-like chemotaxis protein